MAAQVFPTKGNLINTKKSLALAMMGFELMDRKRNILVREMMTLIDAANQLRGEIDSTYMKAYLALQNANITLGFCDDVSKSIPVERGLDVRFRSVMGVEIPIVTLPEQPAHMYYGFSDTNSQLDEAYIHFHAVKMLTARLAEIENSVYRLANAIKKTQRRANALKNIIIPRFESTSRYITNALEEKEREEFSRLKVIKAGKEKTGAELEQEG